MSPSNFPKTEGIDHIHVYVSDRARAQKWYADVLGYHPVVELLSWATKDGPLTLESQEGNVHLALFERADETADSVLALGATGIEFLKWVEHLAAQDIEYRVSDHDISVSVYFQDLDRNTLEITTYEHNEVRKALLSN